MTNTKNTYISLFSLLIIIATAYISLQWLMPDNSISKIDLKTKFSTKKALVHLKKITQKPHFTGSKNHFFVQNYIKTALEKMGLDVEIQSQIAVNNKWGAATRTKNIIARIPGYDSTKALLLLSHYDSNPHSSLGASDAASGVVTILEAVRVILTRQNSFKNDIIICISDAEELGLLGASAFVNNHPWVKNIGLVLNLEARGSGGPSYMLLETNGGNEKLIKSFYEANTPYPVANSLMYSIYKMLPNDTDLTIFREDGDIPGFNFAFIGDHFDYHTVQDSYERMDINTFKHQASYILPLINYYANTDLNNLKSSRDLVFFNFPGIGLAHYPFSWVQPITYALFLIFILVFVVGIYKKRLSIKEALIGFIPFLSALLFSVLLAYYGWKLLLIIHPQYHDILQGFTYNGYFYIILFVVLSIAVFFRFYRSYFQHKQVQNLLIAPLICWTLLNFGFAYYLKGAGFFFIPLATGILLLGLQIFTPNNYKWKPLIISLIVIPTLLIFIPLIKMFPVGLGLKMSGISAFFTILLLGLALPIIHTYPFKKALEKIFIFIGLLAFTAAFFNSGYSKDQRKPNSIIYTLDLDLKKAYWASYNRSTDVFTKQFLGDNPTAGSYDNTITASKYKTAIKWHQQAKIKDFKAPEINIITDSVQGVNRFVHLRIRSVRKANRMELISAHPISLKKFVINDVPMKKAKHPVKKNGTILSYYLTDPNEILDIKMTIPKNEILKLTVLEASFDLLSNPQFDIKPRAAHMMPMPFVLNDAIVLKKRIHLNLKNGSTNKLTNN